MARPSTEVDGKTARPSWHQAWNRHPFAKGERPRSRGTRDYDDPMRAGDPGSKGHQSSDITRTSHDHDVEATLELFQPILDSSLEDVAAVKPELSNRTREKR